MSSRVRGAASSGVRRCWMRVKYLIALALSHGAELFLFDEPTSGLDPVSRDELLELFHALVRGRSGG